MRNDTLGLVRPHEPTTIVLRAEPEAYDKIVTLGNIVTHECIHVYQHVTGYWPQMTHEQQEDMAYWLAGEYPGIRRMVLRARRDGAADVYCECVPKLANGQFAELNAERRAFLCGMPSTAGDATEEDAA